MQNNKLHIVSFDIPWPANYGGVIDVFHKLRLFKELNIKIHLHCFEYGREKASILDELCEKVTYYSRKTGFTSNISITPYIVKSRRDNMLLTNLLEDNSPILFEGLHCCYLLSNPKLKNRIMGVRAHNVEHNYYKQLAKTTINPLKRLFFELEAKRLRIFEKNIRYANVIFTVSKSENSYFEKQYPETTTVYVPSLTQYDNIDIKEGKGSFAFYHGNLSVGENITAAKFLIKEVFSNLDYPLIVAGMNPDESLKQLCEQHENISIFENISKEKMEEFMHNAQLHILPTFQATGLKLKLLNTLFSGRHCIANNEMVDGTGLENLCIMANSAKEMQTAIEQYKNIEFTREEISKRRNGLSLSYNNLENAKKIVRNLGVVE